MAENEDRSREDLTEEASPYRIEEFRRKGQVAQSRELTGVLALLAAAATAYALSPSMGQQIVEFMQEAFRTDFASKMDLSQGTTMRVLLMKALWLGASIGLPIAIAGFIIGILGSFMQIGSIFSFDPLTPDLNKIDPIQGMKRFISMKMVIDGAKLIFKVIVISAVAYALVKAEIFSAASQLGAEPGTILSLFARSGKIIFLALIGILAVFAGLDFAVQRWEFSKKTRMTKQEAKQEHKEKEGDPQIKARIRAVQREVARRRMMAAVKKADVVITNPTHIAIAIVYDVKSMMAPRVVAKGADLMAQRIKKIAADAGVPLVENVPLARTLFKTVKLNGYVPRALYQAVAEVLAYVYRLKKRNL